MTKPYVDPFFLVGGTALALQFGHRVTVDLYLFTISEFDKDELLYLLKKEFDVIVEVVSPSIFITRINGVKVDFVHFRYKIIFPELNIEGIRMLDIRDIAPMKLDAITKRGSKKDFFDMFYLLKKISLTEILDLYKGKFEAHEIFHVIKSLTYFDDAEDEPYPILFDKTDTWHKVKTTMEKEVRKHYSK